MLCLLWLCYKLGPAAAAATVSLFDLLIKSQNPPADLSSSSSWACLLSREWKTKDVNHISGRIFMGPSNQLDAEMIYARSSNEMEQQERLVEESEIGTAPAADGQLSSLVLVTTLVRSI